MSDDIRKTKRSLILYSLFSTSLIGFGLGILFGYLHIKGWIVRAETGFILYALTLISTAVLSTAFVLYQIRQNQQPPAKAVGMELA